MADLKGLGNVLRNMNVLIDTMEERNIKGMVKATIIVRRSMDETAPVIPWDTGNLHASWFVVTSSGGVASGKSPKFKGKNAGQAATDHNESKGKNKFIAEASGMPGVIMGFSANYALFVHENVGANFSQPTKGLRGRSGGAGAKFFEAAIKRNAGKILKVIADESKII